MQDAKAFLFSFKNLIWVGLAILLLVTHVTIHSFAPELNPPWREKPLWIQRSLKAELIMHIVFLGALITSIRNMIPALKNPSYSDEGLLDIESQTQLPDNHPQWLGIVLVICEFSVYLAFWAWIYGLLK